MHSRIIFLKILTYVLFVSLAVFIFLFCPFKYIDHFTKIHCHTKGCDEIESKKNMCLAGVSQKLHSLEIFRGFKA